MAHEIRYAQASDWAGIYINGDLFYEGHSIPDNIWAEVIEGMGGVTCRQISITEEMEETISTLGGFPEDISNLLTQKGTA